MLVTDDTVSTESMSFRGSAWSAKRCFPALELVPAVVVISPIKDSLPPYDGMGFYLLGYGGWILAKDICNIGIGHLVVQRILDDFSFLSSQVFILFHPRYLLNPRRSRKRITLLSKRTQFQLLD
jgi:hypothetical protein